MNYVSQPRLLSRARRRRLSVIAGTGALLATTLFAAPVSAQDPERVVMKLDDFLELYEKSKKREEDEPTPPRDFAISSARYQGEVLVEGGDPRFALFDATVRVEVLAKKGWARVPLLPATVALKAARVGGKEAPVVIENGFYTLVTERRGQFDVELEFGAAVRTSMGSSSVSFQLAPSGATEVQLSVPADEDLDFTVANAQLQSSKVEGKRRVVDATLPSSGMLSVSWQREVPETKKQQDPQIYSEVYTLVRLGDGLMQTTATVQNTILFAGVDRFVIEVPKEMTVLDVQGSGIREWKKTSDTALEVTLNYAAEGNYPLTIQMERPLGDDKSGLAAPIVRPRGVERSKGWVGVESAGNLEIGAGDSITGATPVDVRSLPAAILGITPNPVLLGYKYVGDEVSVPLLVEAHEELDVLVTLLDQVQARTMWTKEGRRLTSVNYQVRNNRKQFLRLRLPDGAELWSASVGGRAVQPAKSDDGQVLIPLVRSQASAGALAAFDVEVVYVQSGTPVADNGRGTFVGQLPVPDVPATYVAWTVYSPEGIKVKRRSFDGSLEHVDWLSNPIPQEDMYYIEAATPEVQAQANVQATSPGAGGSGGMGDGAVPVPVSLPITGEPVLFEKLLALDETLEVSFEFRGLR